MNRIEDKNERLEDKIKHEKKNEMWLNKASSRTLTVFVGVK